MKPEDKEKLKELLNEADVSDIFYIDDLWKVRREIIKDIAHEKHDAIYFSKLSSDELCDILNVAEKK